MISESTKDCVMKDIKRYQGKKRVIILRDRSIESPSLKRAKERLMREINTLNERDVVIVEEGAFPDFQIELYGKDGEKKWESDQDFDVKDIIKTLDAIPKRQEEMRKPPEAAR